jgi:DNA repair protein RadC
MRHRIPETPPSERPRERLIDCGAGALSDSELVALVLRASAIGGKSGVDRARNLLARFGGIAALARCTPSELAGHGRLGAASASAVVAAFELGRRAVCERLDRGAVFRGSAEVYRHFRGDLAALRQEVFCVLLLDAKHRRLREVRVSAGSLTASIVHPREVFAPAVREAAAALILVHNHPSGDPAPSAEDVTITRRLRDAGEIVGVRVLDHVIVGAQAHFSFVDAGYW